MKAGRWALVHAVGALALVVAGSLVNSHQAALSVPDWPLSYGRPLLLRWSGNTAWEQAHRLSAAVVLLVHGGLLIALRRGGRARPAVRRLASLTTALLLAQVLLGGAVVLTLAPQWLSAVHVLLAQLFAAAAVVLARECAGRTGVDGAGASRLLAVLPWLLGTQIALGALSRHPPVGKGAFIVTMLAHAVFGLVLVGLLVAAAVGLRRRGAPGRSTALAALALGQLGVGLAVFFIAPEPLAEAWPPPAGFPVLHAAHHVIAALLLGTALRRPSPWGDVS